MHIILINSDIRTNIPIVVLFFLLSLPSDVVAQQIDSTQIARYQLADSFLRAGQYDRAISMLENLYDINPSVYAFFDKLKQAYESVKRYDDALALIDDRLSNGNIPSILAEKARLLYISGEEKTAYETWNEVLAVDPNNQNNYRIVYQSLVLVRLFDFAIETLVQGRFRVGDPSLFQSDLASLYSITGQFEPAMEEYLHILAADPRQMAIIRSRLSRYTDQEEALRSSITVTARAVRSEPLNRAYREILGWLYIEAGLYRQALDAYRAIDRLEQEEGVVLFSFAQTAAGASAFDVAMEAYAEILNRYPDGTIAPQALIGIGEMHERWGEAERETAFDPQGNRISVPHYDHALASYQSFIQQYPSDPFFPEILRRIGHLQLDVFFNTPEAVTTFEEVVAFYPNTIAADKAEYDLGRAAVLGSQLEDAQLRFSRLEDRLRIGELAEQTRFEMALVYFYKGEFDASLALTEVMDVNTSTDVANDAIELKILLIENRGPDSLDTPLTFYAQARLLNRQRHTFRALDSLNALLAQYSDHSLADEARFLRAEILRDTGQYEYALTAFAELPLLYPHSFLADKSLFAAAEIQELLLKNHDEAVEMYTRLLNTYPGSLLANESRHRIRRLRGDGI